MIEDCCEEVEKLVKEGNAGLMNTLTADKLCTYSMQNPNF